MVRDVSTAFKEFEDGQEADAAADARGRASSNTISAISSSSSSSSSSSDGQGESDENGGGSAIIVNGSSDEEDGEEEVRDEKNVRARLRGSNRQSNAEDHVLLRYPPEKNAAYVVPITCGDLNRLEPGVFLNDNLVDFYFKFMVRERRVVATKNRALPPLMACGDNCDGGSSSGGEQNRDRGGDGAVVEDPKEINASHLAQSHVFTAHFYKKLTAGKLEGGRPRRSRGAAECDDESTAHAAVVRWTKDLDIFSKKFVLVPIVEHLHWSMAFVCNLDCLEEFVRWRRQGGRAQSPPPRAPCVLFMDSLNMHTPSTVAANLRAWLKHEWRAKKTKKRATSAAKRQKGNGSGSGSVETNGMGGRSIGEGGAGSSDDLDELVEELFGGAGQQGLVVLCPKVPKQNNDCDCGVFALQYAEEVVVRSPDIYPVDLRRNTVAGFNARMFCVKQMHVRL